MHTFSIKEAFGSAWSAFKRHAWMLVGATAFIGGVSLVGNMIIGDDTGILSFILSVALALATWWFSLGFIRMGLLVHGGGTPVFKMLFGESWDRTWKYAVASIVTSVIVIVGLVLLIVPGIIAQVMLSLSVFFILEKGSGPVEALKESRRMTKGKRWDLFLFFVVAVLLNIAGAIPMGLGLLVTVPVTLLAFVHVYKKIDATDDVQVVKPMEMPAPTV